MRIGLGAEALSQQLTGIGRYTWELAHRLPQVAGVEDVKLFRDGTWHADGPKLLYPKSQPRAFLPRKLKTWLTKRQFQQRLYHGPNFFFPQEAENAIVTVHDLSVFRFPETHPLDRIRQFEREFQRCIDGARHLITDTHYIKGEIVDMFGVDPSRITAVHLGVSDYFMEPSDPDDDYALIERYALGGVRYCLCVATIEPRKGLDHAVRAFLRSKERYGHDAQLIIIGASGWNNSSLHQLFEEATATGFVRFLGFVEDPVLRALYRRCALFLYPSLYEGFGLPVLEAMASGAPTLISNRSCLPEVSSGAAISVNVEDHEAFATSIASGLDDEVWRQDAVCKGRALAQRLTWQRCAQQTVDVYKTLAD